MRHTCFACGLRFIFCPLQLCHFEGALGSCFTLSLSLAPCCTERIDFSRWSSQLSASSSEIKETQKEKEATTIRLAVFAGLGKPQKTTYSWGLFRLDRYNTTPKIKDSPPTMQGRGVVTGGTATGLCGFSTDNRIGNQITA